MEERRLWVVKDANLACQREDATVTSDRSQEGVEYFLRDVTDSYDCSETGDGHAFAY